MSGIPGLSDYLDYRARQDAAEQQRQAEEAALAAQKEMYNQSRADQQPWMDAGKEGLGMMMNRLKMGDFDTAYDPNNVQLDPGFNFRMSEGQKALERSAAAKGGLRGGAFQKGLARYSQGLASQEYGNAFQRNLQNFGAQQNENQGRFGRYFNISGMGQNAAQGLGALNSRYADAQSSILGAIGNTKAASAMAGANAVNNSFDGLRNNAMAGMGLMMGNPGPAMNQMGMGGGGGGGLSMRGGGMDSGPSAYSNFQANPDSYRLIPTQGGGNPYGDY